MTTGTIVIPISPRYTTPTLHLDDIITVTTYLIHTTGARIRPTGPVTRVTGTTTTIHIITDVIGILHTTDISTPPTIPTDPTYWIRCRHLLAVDIYGTTNPFSPLYLYTR